MGIINYFKGLTMATKAVDDKDIKKPVKETSKKVVKTVKKAETKVKETVKKTTSKVKDTVKKVEKAVFNEVKKIESPEEKLKRMITVIIFEGSNNLVLANSFKYLGTPDEIQKAFKSLVKDGKLIEIGDDIYARTKKLPDGKREIDGSFFDIAKKTLEKFGYTVYSNDKEVFCVDKEPTFTLKFNGTTIKYEIKQ